LKWIEDVVLENDVEDAVEAVVEVADAVEAVDVAEADPEDAEEDLEAVVGVEDVGEVAVEVEDAGEVADGADLTEANVLPIGIAQDVEPPAALDPSPRASNAEPPIQATKETQIKEQSGRVDPPIGTAKPAVPRDVSVQSRRAFSVEHRTQDIPSPRIASTDQTGKEIFLPTGIALNATRLVVSARDPHVSNAAPRTPITKGNPKEPKDKEIMLPTGIALNATRLGVSARDPRVSNAVPQIPITKGNPKDQHEPQESDSLTGIAQNAGRRDASGLEPRASSAVPRILTPERQRKKASERENSRGCPIGTVQTPTVARQDVLARNPLASSVARKTQPG